MIRNMSVTKMWRKIRSRPLVWDTITTTTWGTIGKGVGFLIPFFIAAWFGVTSRTDAFFFAYGLILFLSAIFASVVESVIVPYIAEVRSKNEDVGKFIGKVLIISGVGLLILAGFFLLLIKPALSVITKFNQESLTLIWTILAETSPLVILLVWTSILAGALNTYKKFAFPAVAPAFRAIVNLAIIFTFKERLGVHAIALGYVIGEITRLLFLSVTIYRFHLFFLRFSIKLDAKIKEFLRVASYQIVGMVAVGLNPVVDKTMASWLGKGSVSVLYYADRLYMIPVTFMATGLMVTLLSHWSNRYYEFGQPRLKKDVKKTVKIVGVLALIITVGLIFISQVIVKIAFGRGAFAQERLGEVRWVWVCYLLGFVPYMIGRVYAQGHLTLKNTKILMKCGFWIAFLNILLNYILMKPFKVAGIALATTLTSVFYLFYLYKTFKIK